MASQGAAAAHIFLDLRRFREFQDRGVLPKFPAGKYDLDAVREAMFRHLRDAAAGRAAQTADPLAQQRARLAAEQADAYALKNAFNRGVMVNLDDVIRAREVENREIRERFAAIEGRLAGRLAPDVLDVVADEITEAMDDLRESGLAAAGAALHPGAAENGANGVSVAAQAEPRRMGGHLPARRGKDVGKARAVEDVRPARRVRADAGGDRA